MAVRFSAAADKVLLVFLFSALAPTSFCPKTSLGRLPEGRYFWGVKKFLSESEVILNNKLGRMWKEEFVACFKSILISVPGGNAGDE